MALPKFLKAKSEIPLDRWREDPIAFFVEVLGVDPDTIWPPMVRMAESVRDHRFTAVKGCHDSSKTFTAACLAWWWVICHHPAKVITTAPGGRQVRSVLWNEIHRMYQNSGIPLGGRLLQAEWQSGHPDTFMIGFSTTADTGLSGSATRMQGFKTPNPLLIFDEAVLIHEGIWTSTEMGLMGPEHSRMVALGNPTDPTSRFADCFRAGSKWNPITISAFESPNLCGGFHPYAPRLERIEEIRQDAGEGSIDWIVRVLGEFPEGMESSLITYGDIRRAIARDPGDTRGQPASIGLDCARGGADQSSLWVVRGGDILWHEWWSGEGDYVREGDELVPASEYAANRVVQAAHDFGISKPNAFRIAIDSTGLGSGPTDILRSRGWSVRGVNFGSKAVDEVRYKDNRIELWATMADWLRNDAGLSSVAEHYPTWVRHLEGDLPGVAKIYTGDERMALEPKERTKKRIGHSPDHGDGLALALYWRAFAPAFTTADYVLKRVTERQRLEDAELLEDRDNPLFEAARRQAGLDVFAPGGNPYSR